MGQKFTLITAILMSFAAVMWFASALILSRAGEIPMSRWGIVAIFVILSAIYWIAYFRMKKKNADSQSSGTE